MSEPAISIERVSKSYGGETLAVDDLSLTIGAGEFFSILGPSGCGKTTTLRMIAGFEEASAGRILLGGQDVTFMPPHKRGMGMVFQNYALFPHKTVEQNVAFGLRMRKVGREEMRQRVDAALAQVELQGVKERYPAQLSGGQQQRVALARAIVIRPAVLLCDEPLGALDKRLRAAMQFELKELQRALEVTLVYVTHDQEEALTMSDRIAVMNGGRLEQVGTPEEVYAAPASAFVSGFIGDSNLLQGRLVEAADGSACLATQEGLTLPLGGKVNRLRGAPIALAVRPEHLYLDDAGPIAASVVETNFLGTATLLKVRPVDAPGLSLLVRVPADGHAGARAGENIRLAIRPGGGVIVDNPG